MCFQNTRTVDLQKLFEYAYVKLVFTVLRNTIIQTKINRKKLVKKYEVETNKKNLSLQWSNNKQTVNFSLIKTHTCTSLATSSHKHAHNKYF